MAIVNISQSPLGAFYQSPLLVRTSGIIIPESFIRIDSLRTLGYNCTILDKTLTSTGVSSFAIPIKWSPNYPIGDIYLNDKISCEVKWQATVNETTARLTGVSPVYKMPYQILGADAWDAPSYCILNDKWYPNWYSRYVKRYQINGNNYYDLDWTNKCYSEWSQNIWRYFLYQNQFDPSDTNWYRSSFAFNVWSGNAKSTSVVTVTDYDASFTPYQDLGKPYAKLTSTNWIFNFLSIDGFYLYDPNNLLTLNYTSQTFVGNDGTRKYYLKYYANPVRCYNRDLSGWILSPFESLPHTPENDWILSINEGMTFYNNPNSDMLGNYTKYKIYTLPIRTIRSDYETPDGIKYADFVTPSLEPANNYAIIKRVLFKYDYQPTDPGDWTDVAHPDYIDKVYGDWKFQNIYLPYDKSQYDHQEQYWDGQQWRSYYWYGYWMVCKLGYCYDTVVQSVKALADMPTTQDAYLIGLDSWE